MAGISEIIFNNSSLINLTSDTVTPEVVKKGYIFHSANGDMCVGEFEDNVDEDLYLYNGRLFIDGYNINSELFNLELIGTKFIDYIDYNISPTYNIPMKIDNANYSNGIFKFVLNSLSILPYRNIMIDNSNLYKAFSNINKLNISNYNYPLPIYNSNCDYLFYNTSLYDMTYVKFINCTLNHFLDLSINRNYQNGWFNIHYCNISESLFHVTNNTLYKLSSDNYSYYFNIYNSCINHGFFENLNFSRVPYLCFYFRCQNCDFNNTSIINNFIYDPYYTINNYACFNLYMVNCINMENLFRNGRITIRDNVASAYLNHFQIFLNRPTSLSNLFRNTNLVAYGNSGKYIAIYNSNNITNLAYAFYNTKGSNGSLRIGVNIVNTNNMINIENLAYIFANSEYIDDYNIGAPIFRIMYNNYTKLHNVEGMFENANFRTAGTNVYMVNVMECINSLPNQITSISRMFSNVSVSVNTVFNFNNTSIANHPNLIDVSYTFYNMHRSSVSIGNVGMVMSLTLYNNLQNISHFYYNANVTIKQFLPTFPNYLPNNIIDASNCGLFNNYGLLYKNGNNAGEIDMPVNAENLAYVFENAAATIVANRTIRFGPYIKDISGLYGYNYNREIIMPDTVTKADFLFYGFSQQINFNNTIKFSNNLKSIRYLFRNIKHLNNIFDIPNTVEDISGLFYLCDNYNQPVTIPDNVKFMDQTFGQCFTFNQPVSISKSSNLNRLDSTFEYCYNFNQPINIPRNVSSIYLWLYRCENFNSPIVFDNDSNIIYIDSFLMDMGLFNYQINIPKNIKYIKRLFYNVSNFNQPVNIPDNVEFTDIVSVCVNFNSAINIGNNCNCYSNTAINYLINFNNEITIGNDCFFSTHLINDCPNFNSRINFGDNLTTYNYLIGNNTNLNFKFIPEMVSNKRYNLIVHPFVYGGFKVEDMDTILISNIYVNQSLSGFCSSGIDTSNISNINTYFHNIRGNIICRSGLLPYHRNNSINYQNHTYIMDNVSGYMNVGFLNLYQNVYAASQNKKTDMVIDNCNIIGPSQVEYIGNNTNVYITNSDFNLYFDTTFLVYSYNINAKTGIFTLNHYAVADNIIIDNCNLTNGALLDQRCGYSASSDFNCNVGDFNIFIKNSYIGPNFRFIHYSNNVSDKYIKGSINIFILDDDTAECLNIYNRRSQIYNISIGTPKSITNRTNVNIYIPDSINAKNLLGISTSNRIFSTYYNNLNQDTIDYVDNFIYSMQSLIPDWNNI